MRDRAAFSDGVMVHVDYIVEKPHCRVDILSERVPGESTAVNIKAQIQGTQVAGLVGKQRLLTTIVNQKPVGVEMTRHRLREIKDFFLSFQLDFRNGGVKDLSIRSSSVSIERGFQEPLLPRT
jgi:hypothetical protein